jgi:hypothetical protein
MYSAESLPDKKTLLGLCHLNGGSTRKYLVIQMIIPKRTPGRVRYLMQNKDARKHHQPVAGGKICSNCEDKHKFGIYTCGHKHSLCWFCVIGISRDDDYFTCEYPLCDITVNQDVRGEMGLIQHDHKWNKAVYEDYFFPGHLDDDEDIHEEYLPNEQNTTSTAAAANTNTFELIDDFA